MPRNLKSLVLAVTLLMPTSALASSTAYTLSTMPNPDNLVSHVVPGQTSNLIQQDNQSTQAHIVRQGEGWSTGTENANCNQDLGTNCSFDDARDCQIAGQFNTCDVEAVVNGTYTTVNPNTGQQSCNSQLQSQTVTSQCSGLTITDGNGGWTYCQPANGGSWVMDPQEWDGSCPAGDNLLDCPSEYLGPGQIVMGECFAFDWPGNTVETINDGPAPWCNNHQDCGYDMVASGGCTLTYGGSCGSNVDAVTVNWGDGTSTQATYEYQPSSSATSPSNVPIYIAKHDYTSLPNGAPGQYFVTITEKVGGHYDTSVTYTQQDQIVWDLNYSGPGCTYYWSGTNQMVVSTSASSYNPGYLEAMDYTPGSGFSGVTNITGSTQVCNTGSGNSGVAGSGDDLEPVSLSGGSSQQVAYGQDIVLNPTTGTFSGGPLVVGNAWGWFEFQPDNNEVEITYNGSSIGSIQASVIEVPHTTQTLVGYTTESQTLSIYVYRNTPPPLQRGQEVASPTPTTPADE